MDFFTFMILHVGFVQIFTRHDHACKYEKKIMLIQILCAHFLFLTIEEVHCIIITNLLL